MDFRCSLSQSTVFNSNPVEWWIYHEYVFKSLYIYNYIRICINIDRNDAFVICVVYILVLLQITLIHRFMVFFHNAGSFQEMLRCS